MISIISSLMGLSFEMQMSEVNGRLIVGCTGGNLTTSCCTTARKEKARINVPGFVIIKHN